MIGTSERRTVGFLNWEARGRGYEVWPHPVVLEPLFAPFSGHEAGAVSMVDEGRKETFLSAAVRRISERLAPPKRDDADEHEPERTPRLLARDDLVELAAHLPDDLTFDHDRYSRLFSSLSLSAEPVTFEIVATGERICTQFAVSAKDERLVRRQLEAHLPDVSFVAAPKALETLWGDAGQPFVAAVEFGLGREFMIPLLSSRGDPFVGLVGALSEVEADEIALFQVIFSSARAEWHEHIVRSVTHADGSALFVNAPELLSGAKEKTAEPLFAAVVRVVARAPNCDRSWEIACNAAGALGIFGGPRGNELVPLKNDGYPPREHELDVLRRQTHRSGMLLSSRELAGFVHIPSREVSSPKIRQSSRRTKRAPEVVQSDSGLRIGANEHAGVTMPVFLSREARTRHVHLIGASGTGKSTLLFNLIQQDIESGEGVSVLDPHGDLIDRILGSIPESRIGDVVLLDPSDDEFVVPFNMLSARSDAERSLLASDLVAVFRRLSSAWGDQLGSVLHNALLAFLESERGGTLHDVRRFLVEPAFRTEFLKTVRDPDVVYYWRKAFPMLTGNKSVGPIVTRLDTFLSPKAIRYMVSHGENRVEFRDIVDSGKIFLAKLSQGAIGPENSFLLGSLIVAKIQAEAMSRQRQEESSRRYHFLYADEFHEFLTPSLAQCLTGVRKYRLGLVLAHQELQQVERNSDVASALLSAYTRLAFRVGDRDARALESGFSSFSASDLQNLSTGQAICRVERAEWDFNISVDTPTLPEGGEADRVRRQVIDRSRSAFAIPRRAVEEALRRTADDAMTEPAESRMETKLATASVPAKAPAVEDARKPQPQLQPEPESTPTSPPLIAVTELGKGGVQHEAIQARIKTEGESLGFRVVLEKPVLGGLGQVDVLLSKGAIEIACEVSVENTIDYEIGNVSKCLKAGFATVAVISPSEAKLGKLKAAVLNSLGPEIAAKTSYYLPDEFLSSLRNREEPKQADSPASATKTHGGRVVKRKVTRLPNEEVKTKESDALALMARLMRSKQSIDC